MANLKDTTITDSISTSEIRDENNNTVINVDNMGGSDRYLRQYVVQEDLVDRSFSTTWAKGPTFDVIPDFKSGSLIQLYYLVPMRNNSVSWGGAYIEPQVRFNGGDWQSLGSCGYDGGVMGRYGTVDSHRIVSYRNFILIDPAQTEDFSVQFQFYARSYDGTTLWNSNRDIGLTSNSAPLLTKIIPNTMILSKQYPSDANDPEAAVYFDGVEVFNYGRDWHISVWDINIGDWATGINFHGATQTIGSHARYDVYNNDSRPAQQQAFIDTINGLSSNHVVIVVGSHAPERYTTGMKNAILSIGGSDAKMSWTTRESYICVGRSGLGAGNAYREELSNLSDSVNGDYTWARVDVNLTDNISDITDYGGSSTANHYHHAHIKVKELARFNNG